MKLSDHDLRQLDDERLHQLRMRDPDQLEHVSVIMLSDLKEAVERLNQSPDNSSKPPSSRPPWFRAESMLDDDDLPSDLPAKEKGDGSESETSSHDSAKASHPPKRKPQNRSPGKQKGAPGQARTQKLPITKILHHYPEACVLCSAALPEELAICYTAFETIDLHAGEPEALSVRLTNTKHCYYQTPCSCGHRTQASPRTEPPDSTTWDKVELSQWRLIGPGLAAFLVWLHFRMRASARLCQEFMLELFGLELSVGAIQQSFHESARACDPCLEKLFEEIARERQIFADETSHKQAGQPSWLWVVASLYTVVFFIGRRTKEVFQTHIARDFAGWLMSDGYAVYREYRHRLRCWAHLIRKARGLAETYTPHVQGYGITLLEIFDTLMEAVYHARESPSMPLPQLLTPELERLKQLCKKMARSSNEKARKLGGEFLNDWDAIFRVLEHPLMPMTNNFAERLLRHWVILRRITYGTRTDQGSLALCVIASIIETCRLRKASPLRYLSELIAARRDGRNMPSLPPIPVHDLALAVGG